MRRPNETKDICKQPIEENKGKKSALNECKDFICGLCMLFSLYYMVYLIQSQNHTGVDRQWNRDFFPEITDIDPIHFNISFAFSDSVSEKHKQVFRAAANRWEEIIIADLPGTIKYTPDMSCGRGSLAGDNVEIDDLLIMAHIGRLGDHVLGTTKICYVARVGDYTFPRVSAMILDIDEIERIAQGQLFFVILHEMGHALGIGAIDSWRNKLVQPNGRRLRFNGENARAGSALMGINEYPAVDEQYRTGAHLAEDVYPDALMSPVFTAHQILSQIESGILQDLGYTVNHSAADSYAHNKGSLLQTIKGILHDYNIVTTEDAQQKTGSGRRLRP